MANDPYWGKVVSLIHADDAVDQTASSIALGMTCDFADWAEQAVALVKGVGLRHYNNHLGVRGCYLFAAGTSTDTIRMNNAANADVFGGDTTVEFWVYNTDYPSSNQYRNFMTAWSTTAGNYTQDFWFGLYTYPTPVTNKIEVRLRNSYASITYSLPLNQWVHVAITAQGTTGKVYINGSLLHSYTINANSFSTQSNGLAIGYSSVTSPSVGFNGYIRDARLTKAIKYSANFSPTNPLPYPMPFRDVKSGRTLTATGSAIQPYTTDYKFGGGCMRLDGASYVSAGAAADWNFGTEDFTIECFVKRETGGSAYKAIFGIWTNTFDRGWALALSNTNVLQFWARDNGSTEIGLSSGQVPALNTWVHVAVSRQGANLYLFVDGTLAATRSDVGAQIFGNSATALYIGRRSNSAADYFAGMVDEVRVTKGAARYTGNFTAPTQAHPEGITVVSGTVRDHTGALCSRLVRVHDRVSGRVVGEAMSDPTTGAFSIGAAEPLVYAVVLDNTGSYNSLILDRLEPQL